MEQTFFRHCRIFPKFPLKGRRPFTIALSSIGTGIGLDIQATLRKGDFFANKNYQPGFCFVKRQKIH